MRLARQLRGWLDRLLPLGAVLTIATFVLAGWLLYAGHRQTRDRASRVCGVLRALLIDARSMTEKAPLPKAQKEQAIAFYARYIAALNELPCDHRIIP